jgi:DNA replication and repair protein RecF
LIKDGSEARRKFFDGMISQIDHTYLRALVEYHHCLKQRNGLLHMLHERNTVDHDLVDSYDQRLVSTGSQIFEKRKEFIHTFLPLLNASFNFLVDEKEEAKLQYESDFFEKDFLTALKQSFHKDLVLQRTTVGIHRDDYRFEFEHGELRRLGSQGQQKSFFVALKLANVALLTNHNGFAPILLLDDIFDKLDDARIARLLQVVGGKGYGQLFITDAGPDRTQSMLKETDTRSDVFEVRSGTIVRKS